MAVTRRQRASRKRARRIARHTHDLTAQQWSDLVEAWGGCAYCRVTGVALQRDCVLAISRGGRYTIGNVVPACRSCNASKRNAEVTSWMRRKRLDEAAFLVRHHEIAASIAQRAAAGVLPDPAPGHRCAADELSGSVEALEFFVDDA